MNGMTTNDTEARRRIREDLHTNFFVEAGAGSGKTTALVDRMTAMVEGGIDVEKICAITFTVAASREFYDRFQRKLMADSRDPALSETVRERISAALERIDLCFMGTIDSFCSLLLREHPSRARVPSTIVSGDETELAGYYLREYAALKRGEYGDELLKAYHRFCEAHQNPDEVFLNAAKTFMSAHAARWVLPDAPPDAWEQTFGPRLDRLTGVLEALAARAECLNGRNKGARDAAEFLPEALRRLRQNRHGRSFPDVLYALKTLSVSEKVSDMDGLGILCDPAFLGPDAEDLFVPHGKKGAVFCLVLQKEGGLLTDMAEYRYAVTVRFLAEFAVRAADRLRQEGILSFYDTLLYLRDMLREDAAAGGKLARHIRARHSCFLIDEFQDTDPMQAEVFFRLASEAPAEDWRDARPAPGSLFIVGDPKQSIYRFRGADVSAYLAVKKLFSSGAGEVLSLRQNFRSTDKLRQWFNRTFEVLLPEETSCQSKFDPIPVEGDADGDEALSGARYYHTTAQGYPADIAATIRRIVGNPDILIRTRKDLREGLPPRPIEYRDIMIVTRNTKKLPLCALALKERGIPFRAEGAASFGGCPAFTAMAALISAAADPGNSAAVYRALRSRAFGFSQKEIEAFTRGGQSLCLYGHEDDGSPVGTALNELNEFRRQSVMLSPAAVCRAAVERFRLFRVCGTDDMEYVWYAAELLRGAISEQKIFSLTDASLFLDSLMSGEESVRRVLDLNDRQNRVLLANLHKVKGLEAPVVILAPNAPGRHPVTIHMETDGPSQKRWVLSLRPQGFGGAPYAVTGKYPNEESREKENLAAEETRLLYVAATRAGCALLIPKVPGSDVWSPLYAAPVEDADSMIFDPAAADPEPPQPPKEQDPAEWEEMIRESPLLHRGAEGETWLLRTPSDLHDSDREPEESKEADPDADLPRGEASSLLLGTVVHRAMEMLVSSRAALTDDVIVRAITDEYLREVSEYAKEAVGILRGVLRTVREGGWKQETGVPSDILAELLSADEVYCEVPFGVSEGNTVTSGVMDAVYRKGDRWHVVDYKTNADPRGLDRVYGDQLAAYRAATRHLFGADPDVHTYHIPLIRQ